jgi:uncharacterized protein (TIGR00369 family)
MTGTLARFLSMAERISPRTLAWAKSWYAERAVPFNRLVGIRIVRIEPDSSRVVLRLPYAKRNLNAGSTVHGGAVLALAETVHGVAVLWQFAPAMHRMFTKRAEIDFVTPGRGDLTVTFCLSAETKAAISSELDATGRSEVSLHSDVSDAEGRRVATLSATYVILRRRGSS